MLIRDVAHASSRQQINSLGFKSELFSLSFCDVPFLTHLHVLLKKNVLNLSFLSLGWRLVSPPSHQTAPLYLCIYRSHTYPITLHTGVAIVRRPPRQSCYDSDWWELELMGSASQDFYPPVWLMSSIQPLGVHGMKQSPKSPRDSFPAFILVRLRGRHIK